MNISSMMGSAPSATMLKQMQQKMFAKVDANGDGGIDKSEMTNFAKKAGMDTSKVDEFFKAGDANGDGKIDESENSAMMDKIGEKMKSMLSQSQSSGTGAAGASGSTDDVLMKMMDQIRERSQQAGGTDALKQVLAHLNQQSASYGSKGTKENTSVSSLFTQLA